jgi:hypothetical protein
MRQPALYREAYSRFLIARKDFPYLNHATHEPKPEDYGVDAWESEQIKKQVDADFNRKIA